MLLNHPETIPHCPPTPSMEKLSSTKPVPGAKKVGDRCSIRLQTHYAFKDFHNPTPKCYFSLLFSKILLLLTDNCELEFRQVTALRKIF